MKHKVKVTVIDKKLYPELQQQFCADPNSGMYPCYNVGDEFIFEREEMRKLKFLGFILILFTLFSLASCGDDDVKSIDSSKLEGIWTQVFDSRIQDASVVKYVFYPETSYSGRIELYKSNWPDEGWTVTDLHYRVGETAHMNIFTGKEHDGKTRIYIECDIHKLTKTEMVWYKTDSKEEMARFKKDSKIDNN